MGCLNEGQIQALADGEAAQDARTHAEACESCAARVAGRRLRLAEIESLLAPDPSALPPGLAARVEDAVLAALPVRGATRLRPPVAARPWRRLGWAAGLAAAATLIVMLVVLPAVEGPGTVSAAEVLAHSLERLARPATSGVELREYELSVEGFPSEVMPEATGGTYRIQQLIDHDLPGRYRISTFAPGGDLLSAVSEDPARRRRTSFARVEGQAYRFELTLKDAAPGLSLADFERMHSEACIAIMQASGDQKLSVIEDESGSSYQIQVPRVSVSETAVWDLQHARVRIDAGDYRVRELEVEGTLFRKPYRLSYRLSRHSVRAAGDVAPEEFEVPAVPGALVLRGPATQNHLRDIVTAALRGLADARAAR